MYKVIYYGNDGESFCVGNFGTLYSAIVAIFRNDKTAYQDSVETFTFFSKKGKYIITIG